MRRELLLGWTLTAALAAAGCMSSGEAPLREEPAAIAAESERYDPPVSISTALVLNDSDLKKLKAPDTIEDNPITRWARDSLGVVQTYKWVLPDEAALNNKVKMAIAGGEELPDAIYLNDSILPELLDDIAASGRFMEVEEAFERYASPRLKEAYAKNPDVWKTVRWEGTAWGLPQISDGKIGDPILWVREDWLDALGLAAPTTIAELEAVLEAFTSGDPDGDGEADTFGLALAGKHSLNAWLGDASFLFGANGNQPYQWNRMPDGTLAYGSVQPEIVRSLTTLRGWYAKGWLHPNFATHDEWTAATMFASGEAGVVSAPGWMGGWPLAETGPDRDGKQPVFRPLPFPSGEDGKVGRRGSKISYGSYVFRKDFEHMEAVFRYMDEVYGAFVEDPESVFRHGFSENYDYLIRDGEAIYDFPGATTAISSFLMVAPGGVPPGVLEESLESRVYRGKIETVYEKKLNATNARLYLEGRIVGDAQLAHAQKDEFVGAPSASMQAKWPALQQLEKEVFLKIVYGKEGPEAFERFVRDWHAYGGADITAEINAWDEENGE